MKLRIFYGYKWVPNALQPPVQIAPGLTQPGSTLTPYDPNSPPPGAIKVSIDPKDFPPFDPPPPPPQPITVPVGGQAVGNLYYNIPGDNSPDGTLYQDSRGRFVKHVYLTPFGKSVIWELLPPPTATVIA
jgi:hypothetical protein